MVRNFLLSTAALLTLVSGALPTTLMAIETPFHVGEPAPGFKLPSIEDGREKSISDFRGQKLMLHVWASW